MFADGNLVIGLSVNEDVVPLAPTPAAVSPRAAERAINLVYQRAREYEG